MYGSEIMYEISTSKNMGEAINGLGKEDNGIKKPIIQQGQGQII